MEIKEEELIKRSKRYDRNNFEKGLKEDEKPVPISPSLRPIELRNAKLDHKYKWCSCGMSDK
jgi:hypothetical protein